VRSGVVHLLQALAVKFGLMPPPAGTLLAITGLQGGMQRNSDTAARCSGTVTAKALGLVALRLVRMAASCANEPNSQCVRRHPRRSPRRHAVAMGDLRAVPTPLTDSSRTVDHSVGC
jgi:hypothetical protein